MKKYIYGDVITPDIIRGKRAAAASVSPYSLCASMGQYTSS